MSTVLTRWTEVLQRWKMHGFDSIHADDWQLMVAWKLYLLCKDILRNPHFPVKRNARLTQHNPFRLIRCASQTSRANYWYAATSWWPPVILQRKWWANSWRRLRSSDRDARLSQSHSWSDLTVVKWTVHISSWQKLASFARVLQMSALKSRAPARWCSGLYSKRPNWNCMSSALSNIVSC